MKFEPKFQLYRSFLDLLSTALPSLLETHNGASRNVKIQILRNLVLVMNFVRGRRDSFVSYPSHPPTPPHPTFLHTPKNHCTPYPDPTSPPYPTSCIQATSVAHSYPPPNLPILSHDTPNLPNFPIPTAPLPKTTSPPNTHTPHTTPLFPPNNFHHNTIFTPQLLPPYP